MNILLQQQLLTHFDGVLPENISGLLNAISSTYDDFEKDRNKAVQSAGDRSNKIIEQRDELSDMNSLFESIDEVVYSVDLVLYKLIRISAACLKIYGYTPEAFMADNDLWEKLIVKEDKYIQEQQIGWLGEGKQVLNQYRILHKDGSVRWLENKIIPTLDKTGLLIRIDGVTSDISGRKKTEQELERSFSMLEATIESTADGILVTGMDGEIERFNKRFVELWRIPKEILDTQDDEMAIAFVLDQLLHPEAFVAKVKELYFNAGGASFDTLDFKDGRVFERYSQPQLISGNCVGRVWGFRDITERKKAEDKISASELRYRALIEQASDAICIADLSMKFYDINPSGCKMLGYSKEEFLQLSVPDLLILDDLKENPFKIDELKSGKPIRSERRFKRKDGTMVDVEVSGKILEDGRFILFGRDVTERKKAEETTRLLSDMISNTSEAIIMRDPATDKIIFWNEGAEKLYGFNKDEVMGVSTHELLQTRFPSSFEAITGVFHQEGCWNGELVHTHKNGNIITVETSWTLRKNASGTPVGILEINRDITGKKNAEAGLIKRDSQLTLAAKIAILGYWELDIVNDLFTFNDQFYAIFKTTADKVGGYTMSSARYNKLFVHPDDWDSVGESILGAINSDDVHFNFKMEHRIIFANGEVGYISVHFYIVKDSAGRTIKNFGVNQDITERKRKDENLLQSEATLELKNLELQLKNKELEQFAYVASHDLQEPLRTTAGFVDLLKLQYRGKIDEKADKYLDFISHSMARMRVLIKDLLDFSRIGEKAESKEIDCNATVKSMLSDIMAAIQESDAVIQYSGLPVIEGYPTEIKLLFQNLVINSIKFRRKGVPPQVSITAIKKDSYWQFAVSDNGIGIEKQYGERIFDIFQRLHTRTEYQGSGIGLSHCKKIVELHHGKIWMESVPGEGSTFYFTILIHHHRLSLTAGEGI